MHADSGGSHASQASDLSLGQLLWAFSAGAAVLALPWAYPPWRWELLLAALVIAVALAAARRSSAGEAAGRFPDRWRSLLAVLLALLLGYCHGAYRYAETVRSRLPECADASWSRFAFRVASDPELWTDPARGGSNARFVAEVRVLDQRADCPGLHRHRLRLAWYDAPGGLTRGQRWAGSGKLRPPWGYRNPGGFDYERWLLGQGLHGTGYVRDAALLADAPPANALQAFRGGIDDWLSARDLRQRPLVRALLLGDDSAITDDAWQVLRGSGTIHLVVVSGLHVSMVAGLGYLLGRWGCRLLPPLLLTLGACRLACIPAALASGAYVLISGAGVPALRAWFMSALVLGAIASGRRLAPARLLGLALFAILLGDPGVVHQQGFWLSFAAVAALIGFFAPRRFLPSAGAARWRLWARGLQQFLKAQLVLLVVMSTLLGLIQGGAPLHAPLANLLGVPLVTFAVLPLLLVVGMTALWLPSLAERLLGLADLLLGWLLDALSALAAVPVRPVALDGGVQPILALLCVLLLAGAVRWPRLALLLLIWLGLLAPDARPPAWGAVRVSALDVGQGSAIMVDTRNHRLIYDTGPGYPSGFTLAEAAVLPAYLRSGRLPLHALVVSHADLDHSGGAEVLIRRLAPRRVWTSTPGAHAGSVASRCRAGRAWRWDGVDFRFLHPAEAPVRSDNDGSCVLLIQAGAEAVLLPGDISARVERRLPKTPLRVLFAPHHGSRTSSSPALVRGFAPALVFVSAPRRSRYGHPHPDVLARYRQAGARVYVTGRDGALVWDSARPERVWRARVDDRAYWRRM